MSGDGAPLDKLDDKFQVVGSYDFGAFRAYGIVGNDRFIGARRTRVGYLLVGSTCETGPHVVTGNWMEREKRSDPNGKSTGFQIGYSYLLSKRTRVFALHDSRGDFKTETDARTRTLSAGIQHNF